MAVSKSKIGVFLANQPFRVTAYLRSVTDDLVSRFGSAEQGQTNLDLLKAETQKSFKGGMFQRVFDDPEKVSTIDGAYFNPLDSNLYPTPAWLGTSTVAGDLGAIGIYDWCVLKGLVYCSFKYANPPNVGVNGMLRFDPSTGTITSITLPNNLKGADLLNLLSFGGFIFIGAKKSTSTGYRAYRLDDALTFTDVQGNVAAFVEFNGQLYSMHEDNGLARVTSAITATPLTYSSISYVGGLQTQQTDFHQAINFNNACYIAMSTGLYRFDGTTVNTALDYSKAIDPRNFENLGVFNGRLYYNIGNKLFQFDGTNIEMLQDFSDAYRINSIAGGTDRLWITTTTDTGVPYSDKGQTGGSTYKHAIFCYNGVGFYLYHSFPDALPLSYTKLKPIPISNKIFCFQPDVYLNGSFEPRSNGYKELILNLSDEFSITNAGTGFVVTSSEIDDDYASVTKTINGFLSNYGGLTSGEGSFKVELQYLLNGVWSAWDEVWNTDNVGAGGATNDYLLHEQVKLDTSPLLDTVPLVYHRIRFRITCTITDSTPTTLPYLSDVTLRYTVQPRFRMKWLLTLDLTGVDTRDLTTPMGTDLVLEDRSATSLRKILYDAYRNKLPILFYDMDFTEIKGTSPLKIKGTDFVVPGDVIAVQDAVGDADPWINRRVDTVTYDEVHQETAITLASFGYRIGIGGSSNTALAANAQVRKSYAVYIKSIRNERYIVDPNTLNDNNGEAGFSDISSSITLDLIEV